MANNSNNVQSGHNVQVQGTHSLDDSENSRALHDDLFLDSDLDGIFDGDEDAALAEFDTGMLVVEEDQAQQVAAAIRENLERNSNSYSAGKKSNNNQTNRRSSSGIPASVVTTSASSSTTQQQTRPAGKLKRRSSKLEGENRGLPPPGWHSEAADRLHRQEMILDM